MAAFSVLVLYGNKIIQLLIIEHLKDIFHVALVGFLWALLRLIKSNPMQQLSENILASRRNILTSY